MPARTKTYGERAENAKNPTAKQLLLIMERKKTNLAVSVDVTISRDLLNIVEAVGPYVCLIKAKLFFHYIVLHLQNLMIAQQTHIDIVEDFKPSLIEEMEHLSRKHDFLYFEDRKFADIGHLPR
jgi:orotidine-5'-phosphate decarboxylase